MEANLLTAESSALALGELKQGYGDQQPKADARNDSGKGRIALVALVVAQLLWVALLVYGAYSAAVWLPL